MVDRVFRRAVFSLAGAALASFFIPGRIFAVEKDSSSPVSRDGFEEFSSPALTMLVPAGWKVQSASSMLGLDHVVHVFDPAAPLVQLFVGLRANGLMHTVAGQSFWNGQRNSTLAHMPVLRKQSTGAFFRIFNVYYSSMRRRFPRLYAGVSMPTFSTGFREEEIMKARFPMSSKARMSRVVYATFSQSGQECEGIFSADVTNNYSEVDNRVEKEEIPFVQDDHGYYTVYNIVGMSAGKGRLAENGGKLVRCLGSIRYTSQLEDYMRQQARKDIENVEELSGLPQQAAAMFTEALESRR